MVRAASTVMALVVAAGATMAGSADASPSGYDRCQKGYFCLFSGLDGKGAVWKFRTDQRDLGVAGRHAASLTNRTAGNACIFGGKDYTAAGGRTSFGMDSWDSWGINLTGRIASPWRNHAGSLNLAPTWHECTSRVQYVDWIRPADDPAGTPKPFGSFMGNGQSQILMRSVQGRLWVLPGDGTKPIDLGVGWNSMTALARHGDYTGDGREDIIARDKKGDLWLYPHNTAQRLAPRRLLAHGWNKMSLISAAGDLTGDTKNDLVARDTKGDLWLYPRTGKGVFAARRIVGHRFSKTWRLFAIGDVNGDRRNDLYTSGNNDLRLYLGTTKGTLKQSSAWGSSTRASSPANSSSDPFVRPTA
ncbi:ATP/GTP-binding protein [Planotetraspora silvatica]|uniref:ATP/GTP-binding protein n=1 Tax=Planotetraspora silvatica TaxID=234614 RepID=A0A8J3UJL0_9ACTN|nr:ATP/GTP-binding protein [Planotetraspora silvatica]